MGNACIKATGTVDFETEIFDKSWFSKCLQHDLIAAQYTNVKSVNVVDGCTVRFLLILSNYIHECHTA